jgi:spermidine/putrescine transport system permease protein
MTLRPPLRGIADVKRVLPSWLIAVVAGVYFFLHLPLLILVAFSFNASKFSVDWTGFSLEWYRRLLERDDILGGLRMSLLVGLAATIIATLLGTLIALALARHRFRGRRTVEAFLYVPIVTPEIVVGISLLILFVLIKLSLGLTTIVIAHVAFCISFVVIVVLARLEGMDRSLEEAAMILGADEVTTFWKVTVPQLWPGILSGALLAFTMSFDDFVITSFVAGPGSSTLPLVVYSMVRRNIEPTINAISTLILVVTTVLIYVADRYSREHAQ